MNHHTDGAPTAFAVPMMGAVLHTLGFMGALAWNGGHGRFHRDDVYMPITPMFHVHGWGVPYVATGMGVKQVYPGRYDPEMLLRLIDREGVTFSHCVPTILHMLLNHPAAEEVDLGSWKVVIGGSALPRGLARRALDLGIDVFSASGMSETCPLLTVAQLEADRLALDEDDQIGFRCKTGRPTPLVEIRVVDEDGKAIPHDGNTTGEISKWAVPDDVLFVDAIDKTSVGKIDKKALRKKYGKR
ncbi:MAG: AMP-binding protein [Thermoanaerobaculales bacterium]|nr:AMP-binding protein [Thermoanaerobaculales bacterium]